MAQVEVKVLIKICVSIQVKKYPVKTSTTATTNNLLHFIAFKHVI